MNEVEIQIGCFQVVQGGLDGSSALVGSLISRSEFGCQEQILSLKHINLLYNNKKTQWPIREH